ncbi:MAG: penicillin-binding protein [Terriglobales bacterium]
MAGNTSGSGSYRRLYILGGILLLWAALIALRLADLQVLRYGDLLQRAQRQQQRTIEVSPRRGVIYDRNGHELAMSVAVDSIFAVPSEVPDPQSTATLLSRVLRSDSGEILTRLKSSRGFSWIERKVDAQTSERIRALNLRGIYFQKESKRFYPKRELAAQILGYVGLDDEGLGGIEHAYDARLRGAPGRMLISVDARRRWFGRVEREPDPGENVVLTVDEKIQYIAERELEAAMRETRAAAGTVIVQNPRTGEILALANRPTFNPNTFREAPPEVLKNRAVSDIYEPGSAFKMVTIAGALEEKLTRPDEPIDCQMGAITLGHLRIRDHKAHGLLPVSDVLAFSSNVGAIKLGLRLGEERLHHYIRAFGFGSQTGIELPGETRGMARPVSRWSKVSIGAISMGQEVGVSGVQVVSMVSTIANDGVWTAPRIVAGTTRANNTPQTVVFHPAEQRRVISPLTAVQMKKMLEGVVLHGTGRRALLEGYSSAGKTGTAQKIEPATGAYSSWKHVATFAGFAPVNNPAITVAVILDSPIGRHEGGQVSAPVFRRVAQKVLAYLHVPQDIEPESQQRQMLLRAAARVNDEEIAESLPGGSGLDPGGAEPDYSSAELSAASPQGDSPSTGKSLPATVSKAEKAAGGAEGSPRQPAASEPSPFAAGGTVVLDVEGGVLVPSLIGKPLRMAAEMAQRAGLELEAIGSGVAREQAPPPGSRIPAGSRVAVRFSR